MSDLTKCNSQDCPIKEQSEWLIKNGFVDVTGKQKNVIFWEKELEMERKLHFSWVSRLNRWEIVISQEDEDYIILTHLPGDQDFDTPAIQGIIDLIK